MRARTLNRIAGVVVLAALATAPARAGVRFGLEAGLNESKATQDPDLGRPDPEYGAAWSAGLTLDAPLAPKLSVATGLRYVEYGERVAISLAGIDGGPRFERHLVLRYLAVPVEARVHPFPARGLYLAAGPEAGYLLTAWHQDRFTPGPYPASSAPEAAAALPRSRIFEQVGTFPSDPNRAYSRWNLSVSGALGCELPLAGHVGRLEARYTQGVVDIAKSAALKRTTVGLELLAGLRW